MRKEVYIVETGWLMDPNEKDYENYSNVYDKKHGFYNDWIGYIPTKEEAIQLAKKSVKENGNRAYAIVSIDQAPASDLSEEVLRVYPVENMDYLLEDVIFSCSNLNGTIQENFLMKPETNNEKDGN